MLLPRAARGHAVSLSPEASPPRLQALGRVLAPRDGRASPTGAGRQHALRRAALALQRREPRPIRGGWPRGAGGEQGGGRASRGERGFISSRVFPGHPEYDTISLF